MNEKETMEATLHRVIDEKEVLLAEREQLLEALEAALFALCTVETTECAAARYRARAVLEKKPRESRLDMPMSTFKATCRNHYDRGFADALRLAAEYVRAWKESPMLISQKMVDTLAAGIEALTAALTPPQEKP